MDNFIGVYMQNFYDCDSPTITITPSGRFSLMLTDKLNVIGSAEFFRALASLITKQLDSLEAKTSTEQGA